MKIRHRLGRVGLAVILTVASMTTVALTGGSASAAPSAPQAAPQAPPPDAVKVELSVNCGTLSEKAREYAVTHQICPATTNGQAGTDNTLWGNCGAAWIYVTPLGGGTVNIEWGAFSILGTIIYVNFDIGYRYTPGPFIGSHHDAGWWFSNFYLWAWDLHLGAGVYEAELSGTVDLIWGGQCVVLPPLPSDVAAAT